jgi:glucose/arabinose dehydrogenase
VPGFGDSVIAQNIDLPVAFDFLPDGRLVFAEQYSGKLRVLLSGVPPKSDSVIVIPNVRAGGERGLLGIAVDPQFPARPYFYTHQTHTDGHIRISRWTVTGDLAGTGNGALRSDPASRFDLLTTLADDAGNHNGGTVRFGTDGMLYVSLGDDAQNCSAQIPDSLKGKILRLDVSQLPGGPGTATLAQITPADNPFVGNADPRGRLTYAYGLRNPFRFQVDGPRNCLVIGDVGLDSYEEVDLLAMPGGAAADIGPAGSNYGWPWLEGNMPYMGCGPTQPASVAAVYVFDRALYPGASIISAGAYHRKQGGSANFPARYEGDIFFGEYTSGKVFRLERTGSAWAIATPDTGQADPGIWASGFENVADWRVGPDGALWACRQSASGTFRNTGSIERIANLNTAGVPPGTSGAALRLSAYPSPARGLVTLSFAPGASAGAMVRVYDVRGRLVRELGPAPAGPPASAVALVWDGLDADGRKVPNGVYFARVAVGRRTGSCPVVLAR